MHDISKLHPIHQRAYQEFVSSEYTPNEVPDELYNVWLTLSEIPQKDWGKASTQEAIEANRQQEVGNEDTSSR